ncbi:MAG: ABC transporter ATP-binding protein [Actinomycetota bacterium]|nr:ABC transporter ATP-binding protein [Actinomycetota bacterium]
MTNEPPGNQGAGSPEVPGTRRGMHFLVRLHPYYRQVAGLLVVGSAAGIIMNVAIVLPAVFLGRALNTILAYQRHSATAGQVALSAGLLVAATAATQLPRLAKRWLLDLARARFRANVRSDALRGVLSWPMDRFAELSVGGVMARVIGDVEVLGVGVGEVFVETWDTLLFSASLIVTMLIYSPLLTVLALAPVPPALWLAKLSGRVVAQRTTAARQADAELTTVLHEQLGAIRLLRLAGRTAAAVGRVRDLARSQAGAELAAIKVDEGLSALYSVLLGAGVFFIVWLGGKDVAAGTLSIGSLVAFLQLFSRFVGRAPRLPQMINRVQAAGAAYVRLEPLLAPAVPAKSEPRWSSFRSAHLAGASTDTGTKGGEPRVDGPARLRIEGVTFTYPGAQRPAISDLDLEVPAGAFVAVTGPVGAGKSALARLAAGIYAPQLGQVLIDETPASILPEAVRIRRVGYLGQEPFLFSGSIAANIAFSPEGGLAGIAGVEERLWRAARLTDLALDLDSMPDGTGTEVGELGVRVSGGQRQRIALARALAAGGSTPGLLVLDDPFSAVDVRTEATIARHLREALGSSAPATDRSTVLLFSHRLAAFPHADRVIVLDGGRIEEAGTHAELLAAGGLYARIFRAQVRLDFPADLEVLADDKGAP